MPTVRTLFLPALFLLLLTSCQDKNDDKKIPLLENQRRIECEKNSTVCNGNDAMRFYMSVPQISLDSTNEPTVTEVWYSFVICCDSFMKVLDTLTVYAQLLDTARKYNRAINKRDTVGGIPISVGLEFYGELMGKRWEWIHFGGDHAWQMPTGEAFAAHKEELEEAHRRCCLE